MFFRNLIILQGKRALSGLSLAMDFISNRFRRLEGGFIKYKALTDISTFNRASSATDFVSGILTQFATDVPRINSGLLIEGTATNALRYSEQMDNAAWIGGMFTTANATIAPDGNTTADSFTAAAGGVRSFYQIVAGFTPGETLTYSAYWKLGTLPASDFAYAVYNETNGAFIAIDLSLPAVNASTWTRGTYTFTVPAGCTSIRVYGYRKQPVTDGTVFTWGAQLERGSLASSYITTVATNATRAADLATISGDAFNAIFGSGAPQGFVIMDVMIPQAFTGTSQHIVNIDANGSSNRYVMFSPAGGTGITTLLISGNVQLGNAISGPFTAGVPFRVGLRWTAAGYSVSFNGAVLNSATGAPPPGLAFLRLGNGPGNINPLNGRILGAWAGPINPSDTTFQAMCAPGANIESIMRVI